MTPNNPIVTQLLQDLSQGNAFIRMHYQKQAHILPITLRQDVHLDDLLGIERQKNAVLHNIQRFLRQESYQHILLWGARGTGKSSLIRATLLHFQMGGLKSLQIACDDLTDLPFILWTLAHDTAPYLVYIDDLSFSADDNAYRALKAVLDGALGGIASNIMLCVTSNRRHLLAEYHHDESALHPQEDEEEQISLADRFGLRLAFHPLSQQQYLDTVAHWLQQPLDELTRRAALQYALAHGSRSARTAFQFSHQHIGMTPS
ncbi:MAG: DUF815 domain-containing protein [Cardiobacteriaceae bacterium]|nr:DUF815 domain-containing protein [Cardiobacteriaceae bacterium]